ncbi:MAG TPA: adenylate/guanylate cyclase domain-containing protein [Pyrinomonadaceae bacterium]|nr:adenylate/guanylate cyclase domain-containing protein [Pyrinomonadaceae bacterium]
MRESFGRLLSAVFGDARRVTLEHRLFNIIALLNAATNLGGAVAVPRLEGQAFLVALHLSTGALFFLFYCLSRFRAEHRRLYWPFVLLILAFLSANTLGNAGSRGAAHYYFVPALVIAVVLSGDRRRTLASVVVFGAATLALLLLEQRRPGLFTDYAGPQERFYDVTGNFLFVQVFTAALVAVLSASLKQERRRTDALLLNVLPEPVARELKAYERVEPREYASATVLFTDFVGFTRIAEGFTPQQLVEELDFCFRRFDEIVRRHNLEKIKTIGDAYMAVGGVPAPNVTHARDCVRAALEISAFVAETRGLRAAEGRAYWGVRVGVHTGEVVAGVIGREKFSYDVWGDTVNTASRMESAGAAGRVNVSRATYELVKDAFECEYRGRVEAKGKGEVEMFFVKGVRAGASAVAEHEVSGSEDEGGGEEYAGQTQAPCDRPLRVEVARAAGAAPRVEVYDLAAVAARDELQGGGPPSTVLSVR